VKTLTTVASKDNHVYTTKEGTFSRIMARMRLAPLQHGDRFRNLVGGRRTAARHLLLLRALTAHGTVNEKQQR